MSRSSYQYKNRSYLPPKTDEEIKQQNQNIEKSDMMIEQSKIKNNNNAFLDYLDEELGNTFFPSSKIDDYIHPDTGISSNWYAGSDLLSKHSYDDYIDNALAVFNDGRRKSERVTRKDIKHDAISLRDANYTDSNNMKLDMLRDYEILNGFDELQNMLFNNPEIDKYNMWFDNVYPYALPSDQRGDLAMDWASQSQHSLSKYSTSPNNPYYVRNLLEEAINDAGANLHGAERIEFEIDDFGQPMLVYSGTQGGTREYPIGFKKDGDEVTPYIDIDAKDSWSGVSGMDRLYLDEDYLDDYWIGNKGVGTGIPFGGSKTRFKQPDSIADLLSYAMPSGELFGGIQSGHYLRPDDGGHPLKYRSEKWSPSIIDGFGLWNNNWWDEEEGEYFDF